MLDHQILGLPLEHTRQDLKAKYHALCLEKHPDKGGDPNEFQTLKEAYQRLLPKAVSCLHCRDSGYTEEMINFRKWKIRCPRCSNAD